MIVFRDVSEVPADFGTSVVAIGKFDGVHTGHRSVLQRAAVDAAGTGARVVAVTFDRNPLSILHPEKCPESLIGLDHKLALLADTGIDAALVLRFDEARAAQEATDFVDEVLVGALSARTVFVGDDFRFGRGGLGSAESLRDLGHERGFRTEIVGDVRAAHDARRVSSSWIRDLLSAGDVESATKLLGRAPSVSGEVVHGLKRGRELGFPTANLGGEIEGYIPADGIYAGWLIDTPPHGTSAAGGVRYPAAISVGTNPTFDDVPERSVEAYVLDEVDLDLYGHAVDLRFVSRIRGMVAFEGIDALIAQMHDDVERTRLILAHG
ncbi:bifunctional riboflavin kinase/FAD synthetase [uncultured Microbacterium sp.]|uniref:bifunctional riboflavin kinase/FAD synthetase n=1 Tax=uncultured Microbacterium sp. TaxID=191216 RepID=UPI0025F4DD5C|nr:bifunctional riboflavin kinase/FAD synthetase [uncultured Microbacterium sp.]